MDLNIPLNQPLRALIFGASGAVGRELVTELLSNSRWTEVSIVTRRILDEWKNLPEEKARKLKIIEKANLNDLEDPSKWDLPKEYYTNVFCCLGTTMAKSGKKGMTRIDCDYPIWAGILSKHLNIPHYSLVSSTGAKKTSWNFYLKTKGTVEEGLKGLHLTRLSIFRPGALLNRRNDKRCMESCICCLPCFPRIETRDCARALMIEAELQADQPHEKNIMTYENKEMLKLIKMKQYPDKIVPKITFV
jgi:Predicted nucleoside-diphosphate-sugar epimerases